MWSQTPCVCFEAQTGKHLLGLNLAAFDPSLPSATNFAVMHYTAFSAMMG
jgi:hypothetical protein